jgi:class 3 adenylate cyclase
MAPRRSWGPGDIVDIPPGHDGWVVGEEPFVQLEWTGLYTFMGLQAARAGALVTLLFTDLVDSTTIAASLGDRAWRELLSGHFAAVRSALDRFGGREVKTTGDGLLATFEGPSRQRVLGRLVDAGREPTRPHQGRTPNRPPHFPFTATADVERAPMRRRA